MTWTPVTRPCDPSTLTECYLKFKRVNDSSQQFSIISWKNGPITHPLKTLKERIIRRYQRTVVYSTQVIETWDVLRLSGLIHLRASCTRLLTMPWTDEIEAGERKGLAIGWKDRLSFTWAVMMLCCYRGSEIDIWVRVEYLHTVVEERCTYIWS